MSDYLRIPTIKLATDGSNWVTYQDRMTWAFNLRGWSDHLTSSIIPATYVTAGIVNGQSPVQRWATEEAIMKNMITATVLDHIFCRIKLSRTLRYAFIFEVIIIRYDNMARDRERVHMIIARAEASPDGT